MKVSIGPYPKGKGKRKISIRIDNYDVWSMDHTLSLIILPMLKKLKALKAGVPGDFIDYPKSQDAGTEALRKATEEAVREGEKKWHACLDEMIWAMSDIASDYKGENEFFKFSPDGSQDKIDREGLKKYRERLGAGTALFGKYFMTLWT